MFSMHDSLLETSDREAFLFVWIMAQNRPFLNLFHLLFPFQVRHCQEAGGLSQASDFRWWSLVLHSVTMVLFLQRKQGKVQDLWWEDPWASPLCFWTARKKKKVNVFLGNGIYFWKIISVIDNHKYVVSLLVMLIVLRIKSRPTCVCGKYCVCTLSTHVLLFCLLFEVQSHHVTDWPGTHYRPWSLWSHRNLPSCAPGELWLKASITVPDDKYNS